MARRIFFHIGAPKTGTTYLQDVFAANRESLKAQGFYYPETPSGSHFEAAIDLVNQKWGGQLKLARGSWKTLAKQVNRYPGDVLISHEVFAAARPDEVARAVADLTGEIQLIYTVRDLARQLPAEWQETVKHRGRMDFDRFVTKIMKTPQHDPKLWFWRVQSIPEVLQRWGSQIPAARIHLITVPPSGSSPEIILERFCSVLGLSAQTLAPTAARANQSIGLVETEFLRRVNQLLRGKGVPHAVYAELIREKLVANYLAERDSTGVQLNPEVWDFANQISQQWVQWLETSGVNLVGEVSDLIPLPISATANSWNRKELAEVAIGAVAELVLSQATQAKQSSRLRSWQHWRRK